ncbi:hypothetical protein BofuT4_uP064550.1 [Botrytis cinerea T4]|uniref:Uncharacterized protein n=1 Tax=Botryotinia fuckeliana (strain T4) TaxID=999810 RepID=G2XSH6_BOTF4|nr:hypothetical protein BofuT4_uP064550.1 [Botrytis cinerea T4]
MWNSRHSHLVRQYPDAPHYGPFLMYITDEASWRENMRREYDSGFANEEESSGVLEARARDRDRDRDGYRS